MKIEADFWHLVGLLLAFMAFCGTVFWALLARMEKHLDERFVVQEATRAAQQDQLNQRLAGMEQSTREEAAQYQRIERDLMQRFADLPHTYVMRDDYIRGQSILEAKLDGLADKIEKAQLRQALAGRNPL